LDHHVHHLRDNSDWTCILIWDITTWTMLNTVGHVCERDQMESCTMLYC
jgi:hypothetical protein